jgi:NADH-quinone oxidoreductase subunit G
LIEPSPNSDWKYFTTIPPAFKSQSGEWLLVPIFHIFGSEELSQHARGISQLLPRPYLALSPVEASLVGVKDGEQIKVIIGDSQFEVDVMLRADLPRGVAGLPVGVPPFEGIQLPIFCKLVSVGAELSTRGAL